MCGRYSLATPNPAEVRARFPIGESIEVRRRYNIAPGDQVLAVSTNRDGNPCGDELRWGLVPSWSSSPASAAKMINARVETVAERPAFRHAFERFRCLIISDGFYEWRRTPGAPAQAFRITRADGRMFAFAGLWSIWRDEAGQALRTCTILTTAANRAVAPLHDRMPIILAAEAEPAWLDPSTRPAQLAAVLHGLDASDTALRAVGPAVNDARYDGPECLAPAALSAQPALF